MRDVTQPNNALAEAGGVNVHAGAAVPSRDRQRLERLCRYVARPPLAQERLELTVDGRCRYNFRHAWKNGVHAVLLAPLDLIARLCAQITPPRFHMLRYHGVLAAHANARPEVVPGPEPKRAEPTQMPLPFAVCPTAVPPRRSPGSGAPSPSFVLAPPQCAQARPPTLEAAREACQLPF
ncbi:transposase [Enhygromyxa salina]|uniref:transposase n=1 Tax=Enhygromyxa salina TaxID=215803 RepID=UPI0013FCF599